MRASGPTFGHAPALAQRQSELAVSLNGRYRTGRSGHAQATERVGAEPLNSGLGQEHRVHGRDSHEMADLVLGTGEEPHHQPRIEVSNDEICTAVKEDGIGEDVQAAGVEKRQNNQIPAVCRDVKGRAEHDGVAKRHAVGDSGRPRISSRPRGIEQRPNVILAVDRLALA